MTAARELWRHPLDRREGQLLNASQQWPVANRSVAQRSTSASQVQWPDEPFLIELVSSQFVDGRAIVFAHKINSSQGEFIGLHPARCRRRSSRTIFASVALGKDAAITLLHTDGTMIARYPQADHLIGKNILSTIQYETARRSDDTVWTSSPVDGEDRFAAPAFIGTFPLRIAVSTTVELCAEEWREQTRLLVDRGVLSALSSRSHWCSSFASCGASTRPAVAG